MSSTNLLECQKSASTFRLILVSLLYLIPALSYGSLFSYVTVSLPQFLHPGNSVGIHMSMEESSWFASIKEPFLALGSVSGSILSKYIGTKKSIILGNVVMISGYLTMFSASSYMVLMAGSVITSLGAGMNITGNFSMIADISTINLRGSLGAVNALLSNLGVVVGLLWGMAVPLKYLPIMKALPAMLFLIPCWKLPESPVELVQKGMIDEAKKALQLLRGNSYNVDFELKELQNVNCISEGKSTFPAKDKRFLKPALLISVLFVFQAGTGLDVIGTYAIIIFEHFQLGESVAAIIFSSLITIGYISNSFIMLRVRRKVQYSIGAVTFGLGLSLLGIASYFPQAWYLPFISVVMGGLSYGGGVGPVPYILMSELFPQAYKIYGPGVATGVRALMVFLLIKMFNVLVQLIGMNAVFFLHAAITLLSSFYMMLVIPETKNKTQAELDQLFYKTEEESKSTPEDATDKAVNRLDDIESKM